MLDEKAQAKKYILYGIIYIRLQNINKSIVTETRAVIAWVLGSTEGEKKTFGSD